MEIVVVGKGVQGLGLIGLLCRNKQGVRGLPQISLFPWIVTIWMNTHVVVLIQGLVDRSGRPTMRARWRVMFNHPVTVRIMANPYMSWASSPETIFGDLLKILRSYLRQRGHLNLIEDCGLFWVQSAIAPCNE
jgi:hypothetical protein